MENFKVSSVFLTNCQLFSQLQVIYLLRGKGSNLRPSGYEPDELPLLYLAMYWGAKVGLCGLASK